MFIVRDAVHSSVSRTRRGLPLGVALLILLASLAILPPAATGAAVPSSFVDWPVTGSEQYDSGTTVVTGNITVSGSLVLNGVTIEMDAAVPDDIGITVLDGGSVQFTDVTVRAKAGAQPYIVRLAPTATASFTRSSFRDVGSDVTTTGFAIQAQSVIFETSTVWASSAVLVDGGTIDFRNSTVSGNELFGIFAQRAVVRLSGSTVASTNLGGGILFADSDVTIRNSTIQSNPAGLVGRDSTLLLEDSTVRTSLGSAVQLTNVTTTMRRSVLDNNTGAAIAAGESRITVERSSIRDNGQGVSILQSTLHLEGSEVLRSVGTALSVHDSAVTAVDSSFPGAGAIRVTGDAVATRSSVDATNTVVGNVTFEEPSTRSWVRVSWPVAVEITRESRLPLAAATFTVTDAAGLPVRDGPTSGSEQLVLEERTVRRDGTDLRTPYLVTASDAGASALLQLELGIAMDLQIVIDDVAPVLSLVTPSADVVTSDASILVGGTVQGADELTVNDVPVEVFPGGGFQVEVPLAEGINPVAVRARDTAGNSRTVVRQVVRDSSAPFIDFDPSPLVTREKEFTVRGSTETDARLYAGGKEVTVLDGRFSVLVPLAEGFNAVPFLAVDALGNARTRHFTKVLDTQDPVLTILEPANLALLDRTTVTLRGETEPGVTLFVNGVKIEDQPIAGLFSVPLTLTADAENLVTVEVYDQAGNSGKEALHLWVDTTPPEFAFIAPAPGSAVRTALLSVLIRSEPGLLVRVNGVKADWDTAPPVSHYRARVNLAEGRNLVRVTATDAAGHSSTQDLTVYLDTVPPLLTMDSPKDAIRLNADSIEVRGTTSGARLVVNDVAILDGQTGDAKQTYATTVQLLEGQNTITAVAADGVGNTVTIVRTVTRDTTAFLQVIGLPAVVRTKTVLVTGIADPGAHVTVNDLPVQADQFGAFAREIPLQKGLSAVVVVARDDLGNTATESVAITRVVPPVPLGVGILLGPWGLILSVLLAGIGATIRQVEWLKYRLFCTLVVPLYTHTSRFQKPSVLDHYIRGQIHGYVTANPGDHYNSIKEALKLNNGTLAHHLRILEKEGIIRSRIDGVYKRFYPQGMKIPEQNRARLSEVQKIILRRVKETPGISQKDVAALVGLSASTINYHIGVLEEKLLVRSERKGMRVGYHLTGDFDPEYPPAPPGMEDE